MRKAGNSKAPRYPASPAYQLAVLVFLTLGLVAEPRPAQSTCQVGSPLVLGTGAPTFPLISPDDDDAHEATRRGDFLRILGDLHADAATPTHQLNGQDHLLPPWFRLQRPEGVMDPFECTDHWLQTGGPLTGGDPPPIIASPSLDPSHYLVVG